MLKVCAPLLVFLIGICGICHAQVYKSIDDEGNVIFSDTPIPGAEEIQVPDANVADPVEVPASTPTEPKPEAETEVKEPPQPEVIVITDDDNDGTSMRERRRKARRWQERRK